MNAIISGKSRVETLIKRADQANAGICESVRAKLLSLEDSAKRISAKPLMDGYESMTSRAAKGALSINDQCWAKADAAIEKLKSLDPTRFVITVSNEDFEPVGTGH